MHVLAHGWQALEAVRVRLFRAFPSHGAAGASFGRAGGRVRVGPCRVRPLIVVPLLAAAILIAGAAAGGWVLWPLWWLLPIMLVRFGWWHRGWRRRQWH